MNKVTWSIFAVAVVGLLAGLVIFSHKSSSSADVSSINTSAIQKGNSQDGNIADHVYGNSSSSVTLIEYGDFQCSACGYYHPNVAAILQEYKTQIRYVFRNFPLTSMHPNAKAAASVAEAAGLQGKYWEMYNKLYDTQSDWNELTGTTRTEKFVSYASELGLDTTKFKQDMTSDAVSSKIDYDYALGTKIGVTYTPYFELNGKRLSSDSWDSDKFTSNLKSALNAALKKANIALPDAEQ